MQTPTRATYMRGGTSPKVNFNLINLLKPSKNYQAAI